VVVQRVLGLPPGIGRPSVVVGSVMELMRGRRRYELSDWLGNVRVVVSDARGPVRQGGQLRGYRAEVVGVRDYYSYGGRMVEGSYEVGGVYRWGFNGQEVVGELGRSHYTARFWEYDGRLGRRWNRDPKPMVGESEYAVNRNNPVLNNDPEGDCPTCWKGMFGWQVGVRAGLSPEGKIFWNAALLAGWQGGYVSSGFQGTMTVFGGGSIYGGPQLGTSSDVKVWWDVVGGGYATLGGGQGPPLPFYTLNYNTPSPFPNQSKWSINWGQMVTYNRAINLAGDGPGVQGMGLVGVRMGNVMISTHNDATSGPYWSGVSGRLLGKGEGTDAGWTGGIVVSGLIDGRLVQGGYENFTGFRVGGWKPAPGIYEQTRYHKALNKAVTFFGVGGLRSEEYGEPWLQELIHKNITKERLYEHPDENKEGSSVSVGNVLRRQ